VGALEPAAPRVWEEAAGNLCFDYEAGDATAAAKAFARAHHVTSLDLVHNRIIINAMEARSALGTYDPATGRYTLFAGSQGANRLKLQLAHDVLHVAENFVRVISPDVGGGFGLKSFLYQEFVLVLWAAQRLRRAVRWTGERGECMASDLAGRDRASRAALALDADGNILALRVSTLANLGAYVSSLAPAIAAFGGNRIVTGVYRIPVLHNRIRGVFTNMAPVNAYRGAGRPEAIYVVERLIDRAARELGIDRAELRRRNYISSDAMPFTTPMGVAYDSGEFEKCMDMALRAADRQGFAARRREAEACGQLRGLGVGHYIEGSGGRAKEWGGVRVEATGTVRLMSGTQASGQGHETVFAQVAAEWLGVPFASIDVVEGDTDVIAAGQGTHGARSLRVGGTALVNAIEKVLDKARRIAAHRFEVSEIDLEFKQGAFTVAGTDRAMSLFEVASAAESEGLPDELRGPLQATDDYVQPGPTFPNGCHVCEVEIDPETGSVRIARYTAVDDVGRIVNPLLVDGQIHGGIAQGIGQAVVERCVYDRDSGQLLSGSFMDYGMPRAGDLPSFSVLYNEVPCANNPLGVKGAGEGGATGAAPAVINAILDALSGYGVEHIDMPATPERIWRAIREATGGGGPPV